MPRLAALPAQLLAASLAACAVREPRFEPAAIDAALRDRIGHGIPLGDDDDLLPPGVDPSDGLTAEEAIATALWRNPELQVDLADLGVARAAMAESGLLQNPLFSLLFPLGPKQLEFTATLPVDSLLRRPRRIAAATAECDRLAGALVHHGLDLVRDVRFAWIDCAQSLRLADLGVELAALDDELAAAAAARLRAGDADEDAVEGAATAAADSQHGARQLRGEVALAEDRLRALLGAVDLPELASPLVRPMAVLPAAPAIPSADTLAAMRRSALALRPDLRAAELAAQAAAERADVAGDEWLRLSALIDANAEGKEGFEIGPGLTTELPLFHFAGAHGDVVRAEFAAAVRRVQALQQRIAIEVTLAFRSWQRAIDEVRHLQDTVLPALRHAAERADRRAALGDVAPADAWKAHREQLLGERRLAIAEAELLRARAGLEHAIGGSLPPTPTE